ncbi:DNA-formamidopyrimidine glycosylase family protein [Sedimentibacter saalensis]|uniref:DNA-formamidopyrimidine glycosylase family protein n=1 Tax=Sedimentibacter saalensis TaxID=130788 RepID=UPI0028987E7B|nr:DNA-formamidopyrimidine glycosylase family protein [Sedimentibacter saalensis]
MIEIPEASTLSMQLNKAVAGKRIKDVIASQSPHKFAWFNNDPQDYKSMLSGKVITRAEAVAGYVEITVEDAVLLFGDGVNLRFHGIKEKRPQKHQLLVEFDDFTALSASVQMYGGLWCFNVGGFDNSYYLRAKESISPISEEFDREYFNAILSAPGAQKLSAKALLATEQRIPGLGNGTLQDILFNAGIHPKKKVSSFTKSDKELLYDSIKTTLKEMIEQGGRDTEKDLFGNPGSYITKLSKNTANKPCEICGTTIIKEAYMGGSIYYCPKCQKL